MSNKYAQYGDSSTSSSNNSDGDDDYDDDYAFKWQPNATFRANLKNVFGTSSQYGQSLGVKWSDVRIQDGVLMRRVDDDGNPDGTLKLFAWGSMPIVGDPEPGDAPEVHTESMFGDTYTYELVGARIEGADNPGELVGVENDAVMWEDGSPESGPAATSKSLAQLLTKAGSTVINDDSDIHNWLNINNCDIRPDIEGREFDVFKVVKDGNEYEFHSPVVIDVETEQQVLVNNRVTDDASTSDSSDSENTQSETNTDAGDVEISSFPEPVRDFVEFCVDFNLSDTEQIRDNMSDMAQDNDNELTENMVQTVGADNIVSAIKAGQ
jgi:hypothetical protein